MSKLKNKDMNKQLKSFKIQSVEQGERLVEELKGMGYYYVDIFHVDLNFKAGYKFLALDMMGKWGSSFMCFRRVSSDSNGNSILTIQDEQEFLDYAADYIGFDRGQKTDFIAEGSEIELNETKANQLLCLKAPEMLNMLEECKNMLIRVNDPATASSNLAKQVEQLIKEATEL